MTPLRLTYLLNQVSISGATMAEYDELLAAIREDDSAETAREITTFLKEQPNLRTESKEYSPEMLHAVFSKIMGAVKVDKKMAYTPVGRPIMRIWLKYAAAAVVIGIIFGSYFLFIRKPQLLPAAQIQRANDILPGGNKAVLTLSNGSKIILDSVHNGILAQQGSTDIIKTDSGKLTYNASTEKPTGQTALNTLSTPRGGQYQLILPDGTKVWLNAASSITYPTAFIGKERTVKITGEAYFEVVHNSKQPFKVKVAGQIIEDIGTEFNINAYTDEPSVKISVIKGIINVNKTRLKAGDQATITNNKIILSADTDLDEVTGWKNNLFVFHQADISAVMRQIQKWYGVEISYEKQRPKSHIEGVISRNLKLSQVIRMLELNGLHLQIEGNTIIIKP